MELEATSGIVSAAWLKSHLNHPNLVLLDATIPKVANKKTTNNSSKIIKGAIFFDLKNSFSDIKSSLPNTVQEPLVFQNKAREIGINNNSCIVVYDAIGIYSSPRVWWLFHLMGFTNIAILDGGLQAWQESGYSTVSSYKKDIKRGDFKVNFTASKLALTKDVLKASSNNSKIIIDARSKKRFYAEEPEPRKDLQGGHIPNSKNLPFYDVLKNNYYKSKKELIKIFASINPNKKDMIFTCGSGITASILALIASELGYKNFAVYDGSWTEWASIKNLPITK